MVPAWVKAREGVGALGNRAKQSGRKSGRGLLMDAKVGHEFLCDTGRSVVRARADG